MIDPNQTVTKRDVIAILGGILIVVALIFVGVRSLRHASQPGEDSLWKHPPLFGEIKSVSGFQMVVITADGEKLVALSGKTRYENGDLASLKPGTRLVVDGVEKNGTRVASHVTINPELSK
jgi:hypothetical protein